MNFEDPNPNPDSDSNLWEDVIISEIKKTPTYSILAPSFKQIIDELPDHVQFLCSLKIDALNSYVDCYLVADPNGRSLKELKSRGRFNETFRNITSVEELEENWGTVRDIFPFKIFFIKNNLALDFQSVTACPSQNFYELKPKLKAILAGILFQIFEASELVLKVLFKMDIRIEKISLTNVETKTKTKTKKNKKNKTSSAPSAPSAMGLPLPLPKDCEYKPFEIPWLNRPYENN